MKRKKKRLLVIGGGTGGHVFPGLTVALHLMKHGWQVLWIGTSERIEANLVPQYGINISHICISNPRRKKGLKAKFLACLYIFRTIRKIRSIIYSWKPSVVLGTGGYVSGPGCLAAWSCGIPLVLHEQNRVAGLTNRSLAKIAYKVLQAFPNAFPHAEVVGNPIRDTIISLPSPEIRFRNRTGPIRVLIIGGSQGAQVLNKVMPEVFSQLINTITVWHQTGKGRLEEVIQTYMEKENNNKTSRMTQYKVVEFIDDMSSAYAWADIVICRAGALTVSEISTAGVAALFVPFIHKDRQQYWNACLLEEHGAAKIIEQPFFSIERVTRLLISWNRSILLTMAQRARAVNTFNATERIALALKKAASSYF
ncbi:undecaprenyldiphospho-muramoylpentapeptide beta-N-acetylglucosaminyltransferase [Sodalis sp. CWE]|uniref:undecaprenyldiphospho-muramoylpentapeptide beta-N-acetylglucosaminyltransferase n=1 Tax=Sodalis sp. CWE TaxID=2803816 RepID=UPI001C7D9D7D|nr:undecaprenyldiphospho-muramoylpentapeptide beta-N-acetylglucosaminyltransferase [Sodalis sp. CWE]MBX4180709.1 undecaprenyldiphospho-muramoylpentapeptide beta-N-acetylglucosaminyltransferase [Sodalis sp. CWE]